MGSYSACLWIPWWRTFEYLYNQAKDIGRGSIRGTKYSTAGIAKARAAFDPTLGYRSSKISHGNRPVQAFQTKPESSHSSTSTLAPVKYGFSDRFNVPPYFPVEHVSIKIIKPGPYLPIRNSLIPQPNFMLSGPSKVVHKLITKDLSRNASFSHHSSGCFFQRLG